MLETTTTGKPVATLAQFIESKNTQTERPASPVVKANDDTNQPTDAETEVEQAETTEGEEGQLEDNSAAKDDEEGDSQQPVKVKLPDGTLLELTPEEIAKGYLREKDYTKKTQLVAERDKALAAHEAVLAQSINDRERLAQELKELESYYAPNILTAQQLAQLAEQNHPEYHKIKAQNDALIEKVVGWRQKYQQTQEAANRELEALTHRELARQVEELRARRPQYFEGEIVRDGQVERPAFRAFLEKAAKTYNVPFEMVAGVNNAKYVEILEDAVALRELKAREKQGLKTIKKLPAVGTPSARSNEIKNANLSHFKNQLAKDPTEKNRVAFLAEALKRK